MRAASPPPVEARMLPYSLLPSRSSGGSTSGYHGLRATSRQTGEGPVEGPLTNSGWLELCVNLPLTVREIGGGHHDYLGAFLADPNQSESGNQDGQTDGGEGSGFEGHQTPIVNHRPVPSSAGTDIVDLS